MAFGGAVKLTGESEYRRALRQIKQSLTEVTSEMKLTDSAFDKNDKSVAALSARSKSLNSVLSAQEKQLTTLKNKYDGMNSKYQENVTKHQKLVNSYEDEKAKLTEIGNTLGKSSQEYKEQKAVVDKLGAAVEKSSKNLDQNETALSNVRIEMNKAEASYNKTEREVESLNNEIKDAKNPLKQMKDALKEAADEADNASNGGLTTFKVMLADLVSNVIQRAADALKDLAKQTYEAGANFESSMSQVEAVSGATGAELEALTKKAEEMGAKTKFSASESADAFNYMAMAGWKTEDMLNGIEGVMNLAAASGEDLATTSDIVTDALTAMGYSAGDAGKLADVMAAASSNANTNVSMMGQTFQYAAPIVGALGYSMEDTAVAIGLMANAGIKGEKAGTALRSTLTRLSAPPKECADAMDELKISMTDSNGKMKSLDSVMGDLRKAFSNLSETQQTQYAKSIAGQEAMSGLLAIVNAAPADYKKLTDAVKNSSGAAEKMSDTMQNNVAGSMTKLKSQIEGVQIQIFNKLKPAFSEALNSASKFIKNIDWNAFGDKVKKALDKVMQGLKWVVDHSSQIITALKLIVAAFAVAKIYKWTKAMSDVAKGFIDVIRNAAAATAATTANTAAEGANTAAKVAGTTATGALTTAQNLLNTAMKANPIGLVIAALGALIPLIMSLTGKQDELTEAEKEAQAQLEEQREAIQQNVDAWNDLKESQQAQIDAGMTEMTYYKNLWDELQGIVDQNGKVKKGYEERASFITSTLSEALGVEIKNVDGVIVEYGKLKDTIDGVMEKKKAQIILDSQETLYKEAINGQTEALKNLADMGETVAKKKKELSDLEKEYAEAEKNYLDVSQEANRNYHYQRMGEISDRMTEKQKEINGIEANYSVEEALLQEYAYNIGLYETNMQLAHAGKYDEMSQVNWNYVKDYQKSGDAEKAALEDKVRTTETQLALLEKMQKESGSRIYDSQIKTAKKQLSEAKESLKKYTSTTKSGLTETEKAWATSMSKQLSTITGKKVEFKSAGNGLVQAYVDGEKVGAPKPAAEMKKMTEKAVKEVSKQKGDAQGAGEDLIDGVDAGVSNENKQSSVFSSIFSFGQRILSNLRASLKEKSPSKATREMGAYLLEGLSLGLKDKERGVLSQVTGIGKNVIGSLNAELSKGATIGNIDVSGKPELSATATQQMEARNREANNSGMVDAFKTALSQMKIELDDEVAGAFVERTVTRVVYS